MGKLKVILLSVLFVLIYIFTFIQPNGIEWIGPAIAVISAIAFITLSLLKWEGSIFDIIKRIMENNRKNNLIDEPNFLPEPGAKIAVMLSGGVDSSVVAKILIDKGYDVEAFFMRNWDSTTNLELNKILTEDEICQQEEDYNDAKSVAEHLGIKLNRVDFVKEYWDDVFSSFLKDIELGITPNPDILCNRHIKFNRFIQHIENDYPEFKYVATGHYAKIVEREGVKLMVQAKDSFKDQTYFLAEIQKSALDKIVFPLADLDKTEIREIAKEAKIPVADKKDSTGICFIGKRNFPDFISNYLEEKPGKIVDEDSGEIVGNHRGALFYTIGQRKGLNLGGFENPYFVSSKDIEKNIVYVSSGKDHDRLLTNVIEAKNFNYLIDETLVQSGMKVKFKTRHSELIFDGVLTITDEDKVRIDSNEKIKAVTPGQELVIYFNGICIGGGQIF